MASPRGSDQQLSREPSFRQMCYPSDGQVRAREEDDAGRHMSVTARMSEPVVYSSAGLPLPPRRVRSASSMPTQQQPPISDEDLMLDLGNVQIQKLVIRQFDWEKIKAHFTSIHMDEIRFTKQKLNAFLLPDLLRYGLQQVFNGLCATGYLEDCESMMALEDAESWRALQSEWEEKKQYFARLFDRELWLSCLVLTGILAFVMLLVALLIALMIVEKALTIRKRWREWQQERADARTLHDEHDEDHPGLDHHGLEDGVDDQDHDHDLQNNGNNNEEKLVLLDRTVSKREFLVGQGGTRDYTRDGNMSVEEQRAAAARRVLSTETRGTRTEDRSPILERDKKERKSRRAESSRAESTRGIRSSGHTTSVPSDASSRSKSGRVRRPRELRDG
ncbi:unnamed protein product [Amoebophrya sp. A25]|nr:unnamed protein product [Amoebophrya sp. A25]|eukprot:GSA25T00023342001.1